MRAARQRPPHLRHHSFPCDGPRRTILLTQQRSVKGSHCTGQASVPGTRGAPGTWHHSHGESRSARDTDIGQQNVAKETHPVPSSRGKEPARKSAGGSVSSVFTPFVLHCRAKDVSVAADLSCASSSPFPSERRPATTAAGFCTTIHSQGLWQKQPSQNQRGRGWDKQLPPPPPEFLASASFCSRAVWSSGERLGRHRPWLRPHLPRRDKKAPEWESHKRAPGLWPPSYQSTRGRTPEGQPPIRAKEQRPSGC
ncbi:UNVERIFIED_CONTAM: hypothetical protein K2H54_023937 [Gekko kuhli]